MATKKPRTKGKPLSDPIRERYAGQRAMGMSQDASFRYADPNSKKKNKATISAMASRMEKEQEVQERKAEILDDMLKSSDALLSKTQLAELICDELREAAREPGMLMQASGLVDKYCKMFGFYEPEKKDIQIGCISEDAKNRKISMLLKLSDS